MKVKGVQEKCCFHILQHSLTSRKVDCHRPAGLLLPTSDSQATCNSTERSTASVVMPLAAASFRRLQLPPLAERGEVPKAAVGGSIDWTVSEVPTRVEKSQ